MSGRLEQKIIYYWPCAVFVYALCHAFVLPEYLGKPAIEDNGIISYLTIFLAAGAMLQVLRCARGEQQSSVKFALYAASYVILVYVLREADVHRLFTQEHVTRLKFYRHPEISIFQKIAWGVPMLVLVLCFLYLITRYAKTVVAGLLNKSPWAISLALWAVTIFVSQLVDKSDLNSVYRGRVLEEMLELCAAGFMLISAWQVTRQVRCESLRG